MTKPTIRRVMLRQHTVDGTATVCLTDRGEFILALGERPLGLAKTLVEALELGERLPASPLPKGEWAVAAMYR